MRTRKYSLEHKCQGNLCVLRLFLAIVACYLNCLDPVAVADPFWALATFPVCFSVSCWTNRHLPCCLPSPFFTVVGFRFYCHICHCYVTGLQIPQAAFSFTSCHALLGSMLFTDKQAQPSNDSGYADWVVMESWVTAPVMGDNITWLQNVSWLVSQLCSRVAGGNTLAILVLDDLCNKFWQNMYLRHFLLTWVQFGPVGFEKTYNM
jgi:hypothetical protein